MISHKKVINDVSVVVVDDHELLRRGIRETLKEHPGFKIVGEGSSADEAVVLVSRLRPDILLLDVSLPGDGVVAAEKIKHTRSTTKIIMLTIYENRATVKAALNAGADGYVLKGVDGNDLVTIIKTCLKGERHVSPELAARLLTDENLDQPIAPATPQWSTLSSRERQILDLVALGHNNSEIAKELKLTENTIKHYITPMFLKLGVRNRTEAALLVGSKNRSARKQRAKA